jgi:hypothetical protein
MYCFIDRVLASARLRSRIAHCHPVTGFVVLASPKEVCPVVVSAIPLSSSPVGLAHVPFAALANLVDPHRTWSIYSQKMATIVFFTDADTTPDKLSLSLSSSGAQLILSLVHTLYTDPPLHISITTPHTPVFISEVSTLPTPPPSPSFLVRSFPVALRRARTDEGRPLWVLVARVAFVWMTLLKTRLEKAVRVLGIGAEGGYRGRVLGAFCAILGIGDTPAPSFPPPPPRERGVPSPSTVEIDVPGGYAPVSILADLADTPERIVIEVGGRQVRPVVREAQVKGQGQACIFEINGREGKERVRIFAK